MNRFSSYFASSRSSVNAGLLFLRISASLLLLAVHGWPKFAHYTAQLQEIEDPFSLGRQFSLWFALFVEVICPPAIMLGVLTRLAVLPVVILLLVAMLAVHPDWSLAQGQFGWLLLIAFGSLLIAGPGDWSVDARCGRVVLR
ncbi:DoxX family protein [Silvimonas amylolytica]|uniref:LysR family transcriptional regulator n=1 Tax=Silvimonas amylolytica TaxID=449663 RepID=A0ABQ2PFP9_9NEIS|nr:DoxX family protein [Silvimonas amylolytica]GGP24402.1 LysR family transcriptional regulator [Silvimonas amylolytica]